MSFASTPLGQERRLDRSTFFGRGNSNHNSVPSYAYGAPSSTTRLSPKKTDTTEDNALARFQRIKEYQKEQKQQQQQQQQQQRGRGPQTYTSPPHSPEKWTVKDTSVQIASAFQQAATEEVGAVDTTMNTQTQHVPRSTSVDYEKETQSTAQRRLAPPPTSRTKPMSSIGRKPVSTSSNYGEVDPSTGSIGTARGRSPMDQVLDAAGRGLDAAGRQLGKVAYYVRDRGSDADNSGSYEYSMEEREVRANGSGSARTTAHKKGRMSMDKKAYKPSVSDEESDESDVSDGKPRRRKKKKDYGVGRGLTNLPTVGAEKRRKKRPKKGGQEGEEEEYEEEISAAGSTARQTSLPPPDDYDLSVMESGLDTIPEEPRVPAPPRKRRSRSRTPTHSQRSAPFSLGGLMGKLVYPFYAVTTFVLRLLSAIMLLAGRVTGTTLAVLFGRPLAWFTKSELPLGKYFLLGLLALAAGAALKNADLNMSMPGLPALPTWERRSGFEGVPPETLKELIGRLQYLEKTVSTVPQQPAVPAVDTDGLSKRLGQLEGRVQRESERAAKAEEHVSGELREGLTTLRSEISAAIVHAQPASPPSQQHQPQVDVANLEELKKLEDRLSGIESKVSSAVAGAADKQSWWKRLSSSDSALIERLVHEALLSDNGFHQPDFAAYAAGARVIPSLTSQTYAIAPRSIPGKVVGLLTGSGSAVARPPVTALHHEVQNGYCWAMRGAQGQLGVVLARGTVRPSGFVVEHVRAELATDVEFGSAGEDGGSVSGEKSSRKSAPRKMEVWGLVEGKENVRRVNEWRKETSISGSMSSSADVVEDDPAIASALVDPPPPSTMGKGFMRLAAFEYSLDPAAPPAQHFNVDPHVRDLGVDFGIVVFRVVDNWGRKEWTCLYRVRVFGEVA